MPVVEVVAELPAPAGAVWAALVDWPSHSRWIPLTRVRVLTPSPDGVGARFVGRTAVGPLGFDDPMEVTEWRPPAGDAPGRCAVVKQGRVLLGSASFEVTPLAAGRSGVRWTEDIEVAPARLTCAFAPVTRLATTLLFRVVLRRLAAELAAEGGPSG